MTLRRRRLFAWGVLAVTALCGGAWLAQLDFSRKISTDVLDLLPTGERAPELAMVRALASQAEARTMLMVLTDGAAQPASTAAAARFSQELARSPAFTQVIVLGGGQRLDAVGKILFEQRFPLLFPRWLHEREAEYAALGRPPAEFGAWLANEVAAKLTGFLTTPAAFGFQDIIPADPLLLMPGVVERLKGGLSLVSAPAPAAPAATLIWAQLAASPLSEAGQGPAFAAIERATAATQADFPGLTVASTGVNRFAAASRARIEREVTWLNTLSLVAVFGVAWVFIRGVHRGLHLVPVVLWSILGAWVTVTACFDRIHILVFVIGSLLTGVAIDYGFYLYMQAPAGPDERYGQKVRRLLKPLLASCLTTVVGFALLLFSELPLIRQLGVYVGAGLLAALGAALVYFSTLKNCHLPAREFRGGAALRNSTRWLLRQFLVVFWFLSLPGLVFLTWKDDIRELEIPSPAIAQEDARIRELFGDRADRTIYLTHGATITEAREALERFNLWLQQAGGSRTEFANVAAIIPTAAEQRRAAQFLQERKSWGTQLRTALQEAGFEADAFAPFYEAFARQPLLDDAALETSLRALQTGLAGPQALLMHLNPPLLWFATVAAQAPDISPPPETQTVAAGQLRSLNRIFARYRESALWLSLTGLGLVGLGVFLTYGLRDGVRIFAIPCGACLGLFGLFGWLGYPLNLFHLLGAFLGVCLTHNYSIFSATSAFRGEGPPISVRMSALTTAASFGVLALSAIPVVRALGITVGAMVIAALIVIELEHLKPLAPKS